MIKKSITFISGVLIGTASYFAFKKAINSYGNKDHSQSSNEIIHTKKINTNQKYSIIFVIRKDLKMRNGKISAQVGHAALEIFLEIQENYPELSDYSFDKELFYCPNEESQNQKMQFADNNGLCTYLIHDQGRTQIAAGSATVLAIGPVESDVVDAFTDGLTPIPKK